MTNKYAHWLPPALITYLKPLLKHGVYFSGRYADWTLASQESSGYDTELILEKVKQAILEVIAGKAAFERDSVLFDEVQYSFPVLASLLRAATENNGQLSVLDFGGSLGSSYFQCRNFLSTLNSLSWNVVEQAHFVDCGREHIESEQLKFYFNIAEVLKNQQPNVILLSSVLQYLPEPYAVLSELIESKTDYLIIDRTPLSNALYDEITIQYVPAVIYRASYPCRIFSKQTLTAYISKEYEMLAEFTSVDRSAVAAGLKFDFAGMIWRRKQLKEL
jgi:putative methyltransferase (TIGR04325 family)